MKIVVSISPGYLTMLSTNPERQTIIDFNKVVREGHEPRIGKKVKPILSGMIR
jgi:hypothetical protein